MRPCTPRACDGRGDRANHPGLTAAQLIGQGPPLHARLVRTSSQAPRCPCQSPRAQALHKRTSFKPSSPKFACYPSLSRNPPCPSPGGRRHRHPLLRCRGVDAHAAVKLRLGCVAFQRHAQTLHDFRCVGAHLRIGKRKQHGDSCAREAEISSAVPAVHARMQHTQSCSRAQRARHAPCGSPPPGRSARAQSSS